MAMNIPVENWYKGITSGGHVAHWKTRDENSALKVDYPDGVLDAKIYKVFCRPPDMENDFVTEIVVSEFVDELDCDYAEFKFPDAIYTVVFTREDINPFMDKDKILI